MPFLFPGRSCYAVGSVIATARTTVVAKTSMTCVTACDAQTQSNERQVAPQTTQKVLF
jgi:hypothetical protein